MYKHQSLALDLDGCQEKPCEVPARLLKHQQVLLVDSTDNPEIGCCSKNTDLIGKDHVKVTVS